MAEKPKAFVTGGDGALGMAVCRALIEGGFETHASSRSPDHRIHATPGLESVLVHIGDLTSEVEALRMFEEVDGPRPLAALVATVGGYSSGPLAEVDAAQIDKLTNLNLKTTALTLRGAYPRLKESPTGAGVVLVAARSAVTGGPKAAIYAATKAAVASLAVSASQEWLEDGISVNAILPSTMDTPANRRSMPGADFSRWLTLEQVAGVAAFLVSEKARVISGSAIPVYGRA